MMSKTKNPPTVSGKRVFFCLGAGSRAEVGGETGLGELPAKLGKAQKSQASV